MAAEPSRRTGVALAIVAFVYLAALNGVMWSAMKTEPSFVLLVPLALHAVATAARWDRARRALGAFCLWAGMALASTVGAYAAAETIKPPITDDGHMVMPIGQAFFAIVVGPLVGFGLAYLFAKKVDPASPARDRILHGLLAVLLIIAVARAARG